MKGVLNTIQKNNPLRLRSHLFFASIALVITAVYVCHLLGLEEWPNRVTAPDAAYEVVVFRQDIVGFSDFRYLLYVIARNKDAEWAGSAFQLGGWVFHGREYLVYSGYNYPMFRWMGRRTLELNFSDSYLESFSLNPIVRSTESAEPILVSLVFERQAIQYSLPWSN